MIGDIGRRPQLTGGSSTTQSYHWIHWAVLESGEGFDPTVAHRTSVETTCTRDRRHRAHYRRTGVYLAACDGHVVAPTPRPSADRGRTGQHLRDRHQPGRTVAAKLLRIGHA